MFIIILVLSIFILLIYNYYVHYERNWRLINLIPRPPGIPFVGIFLQFYVSAEEQWKLVCTLYNDYYPIFKIWGFFLLAVFIRHSDDLKTILSSTNHIEKGLLYNVLHPWFNTGLLTSTGIKWQTQRKILPTFHFNILNQFVDILIKEGDCMTKSLMDVGGTVVKDLLPFISEHTLNAICAFRPWLYNDMLFSLLPQGRKQKKILKILHGFTEKIIAERKLYHERTNDRYLKNLESNKETEDVEVFGIKKKRLALLDLLIVASRKNSLADLDIREEVDTFMFEGHDTTATAIMFTLLLLAEHKDIQERVRFEINNVMQENGGKLNMKSLQNLSYLERCLKEALRLYSSVFLISRYTGDDVKLRKITIICRMDGGTVIYLNIYAVHRDPNFWPNPEVFEPDRFLPERIENRHPYCYLSFSAGPRNCIGQRFDLLEMKAMIAPLVHNFYLEPIEYLKDIQLKTDIIIRPSHPVHMRFVPITCKQL